MTMKSAAGLTAKQKLEPLNNLIDVYRLATLMKSIIIKIRHRRLNSLCLMLYIVIALSISSCINQTDVDKAKELNKSLTDTLPTEELYDFSVSYSENGIIKFVISGPVAFNKPDKKILEFSEGFEAIFYDINMQEKSFLKADYGINYENEKIMKAHTNVILTNYVTKETLNTEELIWDQNKSVIYTEKFVKITTETDVIYGENGFESDETFEKWTIKKPSGDFLIKEE